ncbi:MAG: hypothetical protein ACRDTH_16225 [Pseudonocardiaceae bacterium]
MTRFRLGIAVVVVVALLAGLMTWVLAGRWTYHFEADGVPPVTVTLPTLAGAPAFTALPPTATASLPLAMSLISRPVRIEAPIVAGTATVTFSYDPAALPPGVDAARDLMVVTYLDEYDLWLPAGDDVDPVAHTVTAETTHFSQWALAVTDPQQLRDDQALAERLEASTSGAIAELITGEQDPLRCDPNRVLMPATVREPVAMTTQLCQEVLDDGTYRLQYVNTSGMPRIMQLPPGFVEDTEFLAGFDESLSRLMAARHPGRAVVPVGSSLSVRFADQDVAERTEITGETDWSGYFVSLFRLLAATVLLDKAKEDSKERKLAEDIDKAFMAPELWDCVNDANNELRKSGDLIAAVNKAIGKCLKEAIEGLVDALGGTLGTLKRVVVRFLERRINPLLATEKLMDLARAEMAGILQAVGTLGYDLDTSVTIRPARRISAGEATGLPEVLWDGDFRNLGCGQLPAGTTVPGRPENTCVAAVHADLDGNGTDDTLLLWRPPVRGRDFDGPQQGVGGAALLDDGTFDLLEDPPTTWPSDYDDLNLFDATQVVRLGVDGREEVVVAFASGANTTHHVVLAVGADRRLRTVSGIPKGGPFRVYRGGGAGYNSDFGCVTSKGRPLLSTPGSVTYWGTSDVPTFYGWSREFYELDDVQLRYVGREGGVASDFRGPEAGSDCRDPDPSARGPEVGVTGTAGATPAETTSGFLRAVLDSDRSGVSRYLAGDQLDSSWANGQGVDAWQQARIATHSAPSAWRNAAPECAPAEASSYDDTLTSTCRLTSASGALLYVRLRGAEPTGWTVTGALAL